MTGFVYKWVNQINNRWYIGSHKGTIDDGYRHSSQVMLAAEKKYGLDNFVREILFEGDYEKDKIREIESVFLNELDAANNLLSYNRTNITGPNCVTSESKQKMKESHTGNKLSKETKQKISKAIKGRISPMKGRKHTKSTKLKMSESMKGKNKGNNHGSANKGRIPWNKGLKQR